MVNRGRRSHRFIIWVLVMVFCSTTLCGCASFRRKFIRQNKNKDMKEDFLPVLEPMEYKRIETSAMESYKSHYAMVKAYFGDVYAAFLGSERSEKREKYLLAQIIAHLQGMAALLKEPRKAEAQTATVHLQDSMKELEKPSGLRRYDLLMGAVKKVETGVRKTLKPDMVKEFMAVQ